jgi:uncharacterized protein (TIGR02270 family)
VESGRVENKHTDIDRIAITGVGLVTSLGFNAPSSLAAIRSGIANFREHETVRVNGNQYGTELDGAGIARLPEHVVPRRMRGAERAAALLVPAIRECTDGLSRDMLQQAFCRYTSGIESDDGNLKKHLIDALRERVNHSPVMPFNAAVTTDRDRCLFFENIIQAATDLRNKTCTLVLVGCVDSLCDADLLEPLAKADRLRCGTNPEGFVAGEAAGVFLLELESQARERNAAVLAFVDSWGRGVEPYPSGGALPSMATGLTAAFHDAFSPLPGKGEEVGMVVVDLNGERARAAEWALTSGRIFPADRTARELKHPADCTGDCGAAMGAVLLAAAIDALLSTTVAPGKIALATSDEHGARRVLCLQKGEGTGIDDVEGNRFKTPAIILPSIIEQHHDEAPFLWLLRNSWTKKKYCSFLDLTRLDERVQAHLDGLILSGEVGGELCKKSLGLGKAGDFFVASALAFRRNDSDGIAHLLDRAGTDIDLCKSMISALGWLTYPQAVPHIKTFLASESSFHKYIGIAASAIHRKDPGPHLEKAANDPLPLLRARALRAHGELGRKDDLDLSRLRDNFAADDDGIRFSAAWSAAVAGDTSALAVLKSFVLPASPFSDKAMNTVLRGMEHKEAILWQNFLARSPETIRLAVIGAGIIGDSILVPWLLQQLSVAKLVSVAGEAFTLITGVDIAAVPDVSPDWHGTLYHEKNLSEPNTRSITAWWNKNKSSYPTGVRHLLGKPISTEHLQQVLMSGRQGQRAAAALELAMIKPGHPFFEVRAPAFRQSFNRAK